MVGSLIYGVSLPCNYCKGALFNYADGQFNTYNDLNSPLDNSGTGKVHCTTAGEVYSVNSQGVLFRLQANNWSQVVLADPPITSTVVRRMVKGKGGHILWKVEEFDPWYNTTGIWSLDQQGQWSNIHKGQNVVAFDEDANERVLIRLPDRILIYALEQLTDSIMINSQIFNSDVTYSELSVDQQGGSWFDGFGYMISYTPGPPYPFYEIAEGLYHIQDGVTTDYHAQNSPLQGTIISSVQLDDQDAVWILTNSGLFRLKDGLWTSWLNATEVFQYQPLTGLFVWDQENIWVSYHNGAGHIRGNEVHNFDLTDLGTFLAATTLEDSSMYLTGYPNYLTEYNYVDTTVLNDTSGYWLAPLNTSIVIANDASIWLGNQRGIYHYFTPAEDPIPPVLEPGWSIYPNPVIGNTIFSVGVLPDASSFINVYSADGRTISSWETGPLGTDCYVFNMTTENLAAGIYLIVAKSERSTYKYEIHDRMTWLHLSRQMH